MVERGLSQSAVALPGGSGGSFCHQWWGLVCTRKDLHVGIRDLVSLGLCRHPRRGSHPVVVSGPMELLVGIAVRRRPGG